MIPTLLIARSWLKSAIGVLTRYPWQLALAASLCLCGWLYHGRSAARTELAAIQAAQKSATGAQQRVNDAATKHYEDVANVADTTHEDMVADAFDATARYINSHRVRPESGACKAPAPAANSDSVVPPEVSPSIVVGEADLQACAALYAYSVSAHDWANSLKVPENLLPGE